MLTLFLFKEYKKSSCHFENIVFGLLEKFQCLPYFIPKIPRQLIKRYVPDFRTNDSITCDAKGLKAMASQIALFAAKTTGTEDSRFVKSENMAEQECTDECETTKYTYHISSGDFEDTSDFFLNALLFKGNKTVEPLNKKFFQEFERYVQETFAHKIGEAWNGTVDGLPENPSDEKRNCVDQTFRNKIKRFTYMHVYFDSFGVTKFTKSELYGWQDLIGVFGGIVGLCMGFSLLSGAELLYFFTIRLWFDDAKLQKQRARKKKQIKMDRISQMMTD